MINYILLGIIIIILGFAIMYIIKAKKSGNPCVGCPMARNKDQGCDCCKKNK